MSNTDWCLNSLEQKISNAINSFQLCSCKLDYDDAHSAATIGHHDASSSSAAAEKDVVTTPSFQGQFGVILSEWVQMSFRPFVNSAGGQFVRLSRRMMAINFVDVKLAAAVAFSNFSCCLWLWKEVIAIDHSFGIGLTFLSWRNILKLSSSSIKGHGGDISRMPDWSHLRFKLVF